MHRRSNSEVCDCDVITGEPLCLAELVIENSSKGVETLRLAINDFLVRLSLKQWLHYVLDEINVAGGKPLRSFPKQPFVDQGALFQILWVHRLGFGNICSICQDSI